MKKLLLLAVAALALASCRKDPTLADRLEGTWLVNDITAAGTVDLSVLSPTLGMTPIVATDSTISSTSLFTMVQEPNSVNYSIDAQLNVVAGILTIPFPWEQMGSGTWSTKEGGDYDSVIVEDINGTVTRYGVFIGETSMLLKTKATITTPAEGTLDFTFSLTKQ
jgi:hypothetical protein